MSVVIEGGGLRLRRFERGDEAALYAAASSSRASVGRWLPWCHEGYCLAEARDWVATRPAAWSRGEDYALWIEEDGAFLGGVGLNQVDRLHRRANLGYWVRDSARGRGIATRATCLMARYGLDQLELGRLEIIAALENQASRRVAEKAGAHFEGILRARLRIHGAAHDAAGYSITPGWEAPRAMRTLQDKAEPAL